MCLNRQVVPMSQERGLVEARVANVTVARTVIIPPHSVAMSKCSLGKPIDTFAIEAECSDLMVPMSVHVSEAGLRLPMVNMSDRHVRLKQGKLVGSGLGRGEDMLRGLLGRVGMKAVNNFQFIQEWLMHGTDPPGNLCEGCGGCCQCWPRTRGYHHL
ncbi:hypothetical protein DPMN_138215 [Dreissena polymorpha]|uniref:Uncharacterized protein n=1 Tax=Dreissena polymorpha TaxID=45954 RepID=A0A9D4G770_DREPO|nr:hypothetical protein DPMN_138215 [Dreissena polymorpha]